MPTMEVARVAQALADLRQRIAAACPTNRSPRDVTILAVTKGFGPEAPIAAFGAGLRNIGENYYQEAADKFAQIERPKGVALHFIGRVQRNKAQRIADLFDVVQTVDDLAAARALDDAAASAHKTLAVLVQVNSALDERQGVAPGQLAAFVESLGAYGNLHMRGLMTMGPKEQAGAAAAFARARACFDELRLVHPEIDTLSMGMSDDLETAVAAGSTMVRIGTALFGVRSSAG